MLSHNLLLASYAEVLKSLQMNYFKSNLNSNAPTAYILSTVAIEAYDTSLVNGYASALADLLKNVKSLYANQSSAFWSPQRVRWLFNQSLLMSSLVYVYTDKGMSLYTFSAGVLEDMHSAGLLTSKYERYRDKLITDLAAQSTGAHWVKKLIPEFEQSCTTVYAKRLDLSTCIISGNTVVQYDVNTVTTPLDLSTSLLVPVICFNTARTAMLELLKGSSPVEVVTDKSTDYYSLNPTVIKEFYGELQVRSLLKTCKSSADKLLAVRFSKSGSGSVREIDLTLADKIRVVNSLPSDLKFLDIPVEQSRRYLLNLLVNTDFHNNDGLVYQLAKYLVGVSKDCSVNVMQLPAMTSVDRLKLCIELISTWSDKKAYGFISELDKLKTPQGIQSLVSSEIRNEADNYSLLCKNGINLDGLISAGHLWVNTGEYLTSVSRDMALSLLSHFLCEVTYVTSKSGRLTTLIATNNKRILHQLLPLVHHISWETTRTRLIGLRDCIKDEKYFTLAMKEISGGAAIDFNDIPSSYIVELLNQWGISRESIIGGGYNSTLSYRVLLDKLSTSIDKSQATAKDFYGRNADIILIRCATALSKAQYIRSINYKNIVKIEKLDLGDSNINLESLWSGLDSILAQS